MPSQDPDVMEYNELDAPFGSDLYVFSFYKDWLFLLYCHPLSLWHYIWLIEKAIDTLVIARAVAVVTYND